MPLRSTIPRKRKKIIELRQHFNHNYYIKLTRNKNPNKQ